MLGLADFTVYDSTMNDQLAAELKAMGEADQAMRNTAGQDLAKWDGSLDRKHTTRLKQIIKRYGWPTISLVGVDGTQWAWLLAQHADHDVAFQKRALKLMRALPDAEVLKRNVAYLEDRVLVAEGKPQLYGTQFMGSGADLQPQPIADEAELDNRRKAVGLEPFAEYEAKMHSFYNTSTD